MLETFVIIAFALLVYLPTLKYKPIVDDLRRAKFIKEGTAFTYKWNDFRHFHKFLEQRLYGYGTFGIKHRWSNLADRALMLVLFTTVCVLIYFTFSKYSTSTIAFWAAILYACNAMNNQVVLWVNGKRYTIAIILTLLMLLTAPWGIAFYFLTPLFQATAFLSPIALGGWYVLAIPILLFSARDRIISFYKERIGAIVNPDMLTFHPRRVIVVIKTYGFYFSKMLIPGRTFMIYRFLGFWGLHADGNKEAYSLDKYFYLGLAALATSAAGLFLFKGQLFWFWSFLIVSILQWSNIVTLTQSAADRYVSLSNVFMMFFVSYIAHTYLGSHLAMVLIFGLIGIYLTELQVTKKMYEGIVQFFDYHNYFQPDNVTARKLLVDYRLKVQDPLAAWQLIKEGLRLSPKDFTLLYQAGVCCQVLGDPQQSEVYFQQAEENHYINQAPYWSDNIKKLRENNLSMIDLPKHVNRRSHLKQMKEQMAVVK